MRTRGLALHLVDVALAAAAGLAGAVVLALRRALRQAPEASGRPRLMAFSSLWSLGVLRSRKAEHLITHRDLGGYFDHVWSVHPLVGADPSEASVGPPTITQLSASHTVIEGHTERSVALQRLPYLNFTLAQLQLVLLLDGIVHREGIRIVRGDPYYNGLLALLVGRLSGRPVEARIIADHDAIYDAVGSLAYPRLFRTRTVEKRVIRYMLSRADLVVLGTPVYRKFALRNGAREDRLACVGNWSMIHPVHLSEPHERELLDNEFGFGDRPIVTCVARLEPMKHPEDVVVSLAKARLRHRSLAAVLVGQGMMLEELKELCDELGVTDDVAFAGNRDQEWIARLLAQSAVVAAPLAGLSLVESGLSATPIVGYDYEWQSELIQSDEEGILVPHRDTEAMAAAICAVLDDPVRAARMGATLRARLVSIMEPSELLAHERQLAESLMARPPG